MAQMSKSIQQLKSEVLPSFIRGDSAVAFYGDSTPASKSFTDALDAYTKAMSDAPGVRFSTLVSSLVSALRAADPANITKTQAKKGATPNEVLDAKIQYRNGVVQFDLLLEGLPALLDSVRALQLLRVPLFNERKAQLEELATYIQAGREFLEEHKHLRESVGWIRLDGRVQELVDREERGRLGVQFVESAKTAAEAMLAYHAGIQSRLVTQWCEKRGIPIAGYEVPAAIQAEAVAAHSELIDKFAALEAIAKNAAEKEQESARARAQEIVDDYDLEISDIFKMRSGSWELGREARAVRYRNPLTGQIWGGKGSMPQWLQGQDIKIFEI